MLHSEALLQTKHNNSSSNNKTNNLPGLMEQTCNPSYPEGLRAQGLPRQFTETLSQTKGGAEDKAHTQCVLRQGINPQCRKTNIPSTSKLVDKTRHGGASL